MYRLVKLLVVVSILLVAGYFAVPGSAKWAKNSLPANPSAPPPPASARRLKPSKAPEISLPAGFQSPCPNAMDQSLPQPTSVPQGQFAAYEMQILDFLMKGAYKTLGWCMDKGVRDTGPTIKGVYYGTHPAVRIFYSPKMIQWLTGGRQGLPPDGAMVIKEHYPPPASKYANMSDSQLPTVSDWTVMIRDSKGSNDGWFWGEFFFPNMTFDDDKTTQYPWAGFGIYCIRCHSVADTAYTFSSLNNIKGFPGTPIVYPNDGSLNNVATEARIIHHPRLPTPLVKPAPLANADFLKTFTAIPEVPLADVQTLPSETYDNVPAPDGGGSFISSSQCMSCHGGLNGPFGPVMFLPSPGTPPPGTVAGANVSPYGEWRWSPMGLGGRDPIFFAQLESEFAFLKTLPPPQNEQMTTLVRNGCMTCHGAMGKRQFDVDSPGGTSDFQLDFRQLKDRTDPHFKYGALARDGISCLVCHRNKRDITPPGTTPLEYFLANSITGKFQVDTPDKVFGPFADNAIVPYAMANGVGMKPQFNPYTQSSRMCGSCHTIDLPVADGKPGQRNLEQVTYLEWLNSQYQTEFGQPTPNWRSCQDCHMTGSYHSDKKQIDVDPIQSKIAIIQDETYPISDHQVSTDQITVQKRTQGYARHTFLGLNVFLLEIFNQFNDVLGVRTGDYMTGSTTDLQDTIDNFVQQAQTKTAKIEVNASMAGSQQLTANVAVTSFVGHRFPSGVGFRRAFIELKVIEHQNNQDKVVWCSGCTNNLGVILDGKGQVLPSEFFSDFKDINGNTFQAFQPNHDFIASQDQVQIYEEILWNAENRFTTNFIRRDKTIKDNRLIPTGFTAKGPDPSLNGRYLESTLPEGDSVVTDPDYSKFAGSGVDHVTYRITLPAGVDPSKCSVQATLNYQSIPPYYLNDRFKAAPDGDATKRLYYLTSNLNLTGTPVEGWKLTVVSANAPIFGLGARPHPIIGPKLPIDAANGPISILEPDGRATIDSALVSLKVRLGQQTNRSSFRALLNGHDVASLFSRASSLACTVSACDLTAVVKSRDGLLRGRNELRVEVRGPGATTNSDSQIFVVK